MKKTISLSYAACMNDTHIKEVADAGFTGVDLEFFTDVDVLKKGNPDENIAKLEAQLSKHRLTCTQVHLPVYNIFTSSEIEEEETEQNMEFALYTMSKLHVKWGAFHPMSSTNFNYDRKRAMHDNRERLKKHLETAAKYDVGIAVENIPIFPDCPQYHFFTSDVEDHVELVDSLNSKHIGICWDTGHANLMSYNQAEVIDLLGDRIKILHVSNNHENMDEHLCPALGTLTWEPVISALKKHGYSGNLNLEVTIPKDCRKEYLMFCGAAAEMLKKMF